MEVRVERSKNRVVLILNGVNGPFPGMQTCVLAMAYNPRSPQVE
jgi:hypothetical protein